MQTDEVNPYHVSVVKFWLMSGIPLQCLSSHTQAHITFKYMPCIIEQYCSTFIDTRKLFYCINNKKRERLGMNEQECNWFRGGSPFFASL